MRAILSCLAKLPPLCRLYCVTRRYGTFQDDAKLYMVMEFVPGGELFGHLRAAGRFTAAAARFYTACVVAALDHLHCHDIIYRSVAHLNSGFAEHPEP